MPQAHYDKKIILHVNAVEKNLEFQKALSDYFYYITQILRDLTYKTGNSYIKNIYHNSYLNIVISW